MVCRPERQAKCDFQGLSVSQAMEASREPCEVGIRLDLASLEARPWLRFPKVSSSLNILTAEILSVLPGAGSTWLPVSAAWDLAQRDPTRRCPYTREVNASYHSKSAFVAPSLGAKLPSHPSQGPCLAPLLVFPGADLAATAPSTPPEL